MSRLLRHLTVVGLLALVPLAACGDDGASAGKDRDGSALVATPVPATPAPTVGPLPAWAKHAAKLCRGYRTASAKAAKPYQHKVERHEDLVKAADAVKPLADDLIADLKALDVPPKERWEQFVGALERSFAYADAYAKTLHTSEQLPAQQREAFLDDMSSASEFLQDYPIAACRPPL